MTAANWQRHPTDCHYVIKLEKNTADVKQHVTQYQSIISELRKEISRLQTKVEDQSRSNSANSTSSQLTSECPPILIGANCFSEANYYSIQSAKAK